MILCLFTKNVLELKKKKSTGAFPQDVVRSWEYDNLEKTDMALALPRQSQKYEDYEFVGYRIIKFTGNFTDRNLSFLTPVCHALNV